MGHGTEVATNLLVFSGCYPSSPLVFDAHLMRICEDYFMSLILRHPSRVTGSSLQKVGPEVCLEESPKR